MFEWISQSFKDLENVSPSLSLCFGLIDNVKDLLFHHVLLIARHYIYTCRMSFRCIYRYFNMNSIEIEKQIAFYNNNSNVFVRTWSRFKNNLLQNLLHKQFIRSIKRRIPWLEIKYLVWLFVWFYFTICTYFLLDLFVYFRLVPFCFWWQYLFSLFSHTN